MFIMFRVTKSKYYKSTSKKYKFIIYIYVSVINPTPRNTHTAKDISKENKKNYTYICSIKSISNNKK